ncbi:MAG: TonB-dependent receptor domain-containing protein, partial [Sphingomonadaceae bacterium]
TRIKDYQTNAFVPGPVTPVLILTNAGNVKSEGVEFDLKARPFGALRLSLNGSYNDAHYARFSNGPASAELAATGINTADLTGQPLVGAPRWIVNGGARYEWPLTDVLRQFVVVNYAWRTEAEGYIDNSRFARIPTYGLLNLTTGWRWGPGDKAWQLVLWARNARDKRYFLSATASQTNGAGAYLASVGTPRTVGVTVSRDF